LSKRFNGWEYKNYIGKLLKLCHNPLGLSEEALKELVEKLVNLNQDEGYKFWLDFKKHYDTNTEQTMKFVLSYVPKGLRPGPKPEESAKSFFSFFRSFFGFFRRTHGPKTPGS